MEPEKKKLDYFAFYIEYHWYGNVFTEKHSEQ